MLISVIIPVFNDSKGLKVTLESIKQYLGNRKDIEIIVCNDGGGDAISRIVENYSAIEVRLEVNKGSYAARNKGIEKAKGKILVFLDADQQIGEKWLDAGINSLRDADYAGGQIKIRFNGKATSWEEYDAMTAFPVEHYLETQHFAPTANLFVRKEIFEKVGNFNEKLRSGGDYNFGVRVFNHGGKQVYAPEAITIHPARDKTEQMKKLKRTAIGTADIALLIEDTNKLIFILNAFRRLILSLVEMAWRFLRYPFYDFWASERPTFRFIYMRKLRKSVYFWNLMRRAIEILIITVPYSTDKTS